MRSPTRFLGVLNPALFRAPVCPNSVSSYSLSSFFLSSLTTFCLQQSPSPGPYLPPTAYSYDYSSRLLPYLKFYKLWSYQASHLCSYPCSYWLFLGSCRGLHPKHIFHGPTELPYKLMKLPILTKSFFRVQLQG